MIIVKSRSSALDWVVYHESIASPRSYVLLLNKTDAAVGVADYWNSSGPTSTTFGIGPYGGNNTASATYVAYCFAPVAGYSAFGSYTGNNSADGPFVYTGFRPRYVMAKASSSTSNWVIYDTSRDPYNVSIAALYANTSGAEVTVGSLDIDILSNGFKWREGGGQGNDSSVTYIYAAFAESPFKYANAR